MSHEYICDITGDIVTADNIGESVLAQQGVMFQGKPFDIELVVKIDGFNGAKQTHIKPSLWPTIMEKVKDWLVNEYGP